jgi:hypothetical protein
VEVKSSLGVNDIKEMIEDLREFRTFFPEYSQKKLYGLNDHHQKTGTSIQAQTLKGLANVEVCT